MRKKLIVAFTFLGGIYFFLEFLLPEPIPVGGASFFFRENLGLRWKLFPREGLFFGAYHEQISTAAVLVGVMAIGLGLINILRVHGARLARLREGALNSAALLGGILVTLVLGFWDWGAPDSTPAAAYNSIIMGTKGLFTALSSSMFSLLAFYVATAAYRAFRVKSGEAALLMLSALLVMLGQIPMGVWLYDFAIVAPAKYWLGVAPAWSITDIRLWILRKLNVPAFRAISLGFGVAGLSMAMRMWLSMETKSFFRVED